MQDGVEEKDYILKKLADFARERVDMAKRKVPSEEIRKRAYELPKGTFAFEKVLKNPGVSFICECKKASPSKGVIAPDFPYIQIVLTEPKWFLGRDQYLKEIAEQVKIPCLRKDFTVDEYMIYEAKLLGASAILLICSLLTEKEIKKYLEICEELGLSALVEAHDEQEIERALRAGSRVIGVNNRNLKDFTVDTANSKRLRRQVPEDILFVAESGIRCAKDVADLYQIGVDAVLVGETLMRAGNKKEKLKELRGE